jgi:hypothetical protein
VQSIPSIHHELKAWQSGSVHVRTLPGDGSGPIVLKNSTRKFGRKNFGHEKAIAVEFLTTTSSSRTLVAKRFLKIDTFSPAATQTPPPVAT